MWKDLARWPRTLMRRPKKWRAWLTRTRPSGQVSRGCSCALPPPVLSLMFPTAAQIPAGCQVNLSAALSVHQTASVKLKGFFLTENVSLPSEGACIHTHTQVFCPLGASHGQAEKHISAEGAREQPSTWHIKRVLLHCIEQGCGKHKGEGCRPAERLFQCLAQFVSHIQLWDTESMAYPNWA